MADKTITAYAQQGDTVDLICYRHYGYTEGVSDAVLTANRHLADQGTVLDEGTPVVLPVVATQQKNKQAISLWE